MILPKNCKALGLRAAIFECIFMHAIVLWIRGPVSCGQNLDTLYQFYKDIEAEICEILKIF